MHLYYPTHYFCNYQAIKLIACHSRRKADYLSYYLEWLQRGTAWADLGFRCFAHYYQPEKNRGLWLWPSAEEEVVKYWCAARQAWQEGRVKGAFFYLGAVAHLLQDLCVPYHAAVVPFKGHQEYERWAGENYYRFANCDKSRWQDQIPTPLSGNWPVQMLTNNASLAFSYFPYLLKNNIKAQLANIFSEITAILLPQAIASTAGLFDLFLEMVVERNERVADKMAK